MVMAGACCARQMEEEAEEVQGGLQGCQLLRTRQTRDNGRINVPPK